MEHSDFIYKLNIVIGIIIILGAVCSEFSTAECVIMIALAWIIIVKDNRTGGDK